VNQFLIFVGKASRLIKILYYRILPMIVCLFSQNYSAGSAGRQTENGRRF